MTNETVRPGQLVGNLALICDSGNAPAPAGADLKIPTDSATFWFADWRISGTKVDAHDDRAFGPILFSQYTLSLGVMKLTAQMPPLGAQDSQDVRLQVKKRASWSTIGESKIHSDARTATFRIANWDDTNDVAFRLAYNLINKDGRSQEHFWDGVIRRDPVDKPVITVADISCNTHQAFPNAEFVQKMAKLDPDLLAFTGDQFYESSGGYSVIRTPVDKAIIDYLRKWYLHGWTWRELTRNRSSVSIPDDHDVYQGNLWGESGAGRKTTQEAGGYDMAPEWVNVVYRTQTAHHPDPDDPLPAARGTIQYYGPMTYGRVSFAILADRQYKSGPEGKAPKTDTQRGDHVMDPAFDPKTADVAGVELLGPKQEQFLRDWAADWHGADMKAVISQTIFTALPTTHGNERMILRADYDTNAWPQIAAQSRRARDAQGLCVSHRRRPAHPVSGAVRRRCASRRSGCVRRTGHQRGLPAMVRASDGNVAAAEEREPDRRFHRQLRTPAHGARSQERRGQAASGRREAAARRQGLRVGCRGFDKKNRRVTIDCWPYLADVAAKDTQMPGWPVTIDIVQTHARNAAAHLPTLRVSGITNPVVQIVDEESGEIVYTLRIAGPSWRPHVFAPGTYTIRVTDPDTGRERVMKGVVAGPGGPETLDVRL